MAIVTVTGFTADRMRQIQNETVVSGEVAAPISFSSAAMEAPSTQASSEDPRVSPV